MCHACSADAGPLTFPPRPPGCNCLNLGGERIISVHMETARQIVQSPHFFGDVQYIDYRWGGAGGGAGATQDALRGGWRYTGVV